MVVCWSQGDKSWRPLAAAQPTHAQGLHLCTRNQSYRRSSGAALRYRRGGTEDKGRTCPKSGASASREPASPTPVPPLLAKLKPEEGGLQYVMTLGSVGNAFPQGQLCEGGSSGPLRECRAYLEGQGFASA